MQFITDGLTHRFDSSTRPRNLLSARNNAAAVSAAIRKELGRGHTSGPFRGPPFLHTHCSPIVAVEKPEGSHRLILDLSSPRGGGGVAINEGIDRQEFSITYSKFDDAVDIVCKLGAGTHMVKIDIKHAFRICPVKKAQWPLLCYTWQGTFFVDTRLPFGLRSSPYIFTALADLLLWILVYIAGIRYCIHYLDDRPVTWHALKFYTDASDKGFGVVYDRRWLFSLWEHEVIAHANINVRELFAIVAAVMAWGEDWRNKQIVIYTDSLVIACAWRTGTSRDNQVMRLVRCLFTFIALRSINIHMTHIPGLTNKKADTLSRLQFQEFHKRHPEAERHLTPIPPGSLEHLEVERRRYLASALATTSEETYQTALTQYLHFCIQVGVNPYPLQEYILEASSTSLACRVGYKTIPWDHSGASPQDHRYALPRVHFMWHSQLSNHIVRYPKILSSFSI